MANKSDSIADIVADYLAEQEEYLVPAKKVWQALALPQTSWVTFLDAIKTDDRFSFQEARDTFEDSDMIMSEKNHEEAEMEKLGYYSGPRIMLKSRTPTPEELFRNIARQLQTMQDALDKAYKVRPKGDKATEKKLLEARKKSKDLEEKLLDTFKKSKSAN